jgi:hypothetical protein
MVNLIWCWNTRCPSSGGTALQSTTRYSSALIIGPRGERGFAKAAFTELQWPLAVIAAKALPSRQSGLRFRPAAQLLHEQFLTSGLRAMRARSRFGNTNERGRLPGLDRLLARPT